MSETSTRKKNNFSNKILSWTRKHSSSLVCVLVDFVWLVGIVVGGPCLFNIFGKDKTSNTIPEREEKTTKNAHLIKKIIWKKLFEKKTFLTLNNNENSPNSKNLLIVCFFFGISLCLFVLFVQQSCQRFLAVHLVQQQGFKTLWPLDSRSAQQKENSEEKTDSWKQEWKFRWEFLNFNASFRTRVVEFGGRRSLSNEFYA